MPQYGIAQFYDQVSNDDPFNLNRRDSEIIIGADDKAKTIPILPMTPSGIMSQAPLRFDTSFGVANEPDEEQVEFLGSRPNKFKEGLGKLFEFLQRFSPIAAIGRGIDSLRDRIDTRRAIKEDIIKDSQGDINIVDLTGGDGGGGYQPTTQEQNVSRTASRVSGGKTRAYGL